MGKAKMDKRGRILIPFEDREKLGLRPGIEIDLVRENGVLVVKPIIPKPIRIDAHHHKWGKEAFLDAGEAAFGE